MSETKQKQKRCRACGRKTLHVAVIKKQDLGCAFIFANLLLSVVTLGLWIPVFVLIFGMGTLSNAVAPMASRYHCQMCGKKN